MDSTLSPKVKAIKGKIEAHSLNLNTYEIKGRAGALDVN
jgi:hypothetical protein